MSFVSFGIDMDTGILDDEAQKTWLFPSFLDLQVATVPAVETLDAVGFATSISFKLMPFSILMRIC